MDDQIPNYEILAQLRNLLVVRETFFTAPSQGAN